VDIFQFVKFEFLIYGDIGTHAHWMLSVGHFGGGQPAVGDDVSHVLYQPDGGVQWTWHYSVSPVLRGFRHRLRRSSRLLGALCHSLVNHAHRNQ